ncbi:hypothetical protein BGW38_002578 [Lunasporangiospora selenospora]|uniref:Uncharacterized protein n=1 Tax=Lunasporangiospora selenospora TaxID=979761 RepID=A0A9P6FSK4_9FUNG|nr:hypothetical protein BGW38_002578 [Lunasporangiospora selenospora]
MPLASLSSATAVPQSASPSQGLAATDPSGTSFSSPPTEPLLSFFLEEGSSEEDVDTFTLMQLQPHIEALEGFAPLMTRVIQHSIHERSQLVLMFLRRHIASSGATGDRNLYASRNNLLTTPASDRDSQKSSTRVIQELNDAIDQIKAKVMALEMSKQESALVDKNVLQRVHELVEILQKSMDVLWELLVEFKLKYQKQQDQVFVDGYSQLVESVVQKLQIKKLELRKTVYDPDTILKLSVIRDQLDALEQQLQRQASENSELVEQYRSAGKDFNDIVQAYTEVKERIETVQDDIRRLF